MMKDGPPGRTARRYRRPWRREQEHKGASANPEKSGGAKLRDYGTDLT